MDKDKFDQLIEKFNSDGKASHELDRYKVENAVILAAGITKDTIYAPPKGLFKIHGIPIIERQIEQLKEVGIEDIYVVVGYKKEMFFYLEDKYNIKLIGNSRLDRNNIYSLYLAREKLKNTYVCACDYYYEDNPFLAYEYCSYHATAYLEAAHDKFIIDTNQEGKIIGLTAGADKGECIHGFAYFDRNFSKTIASLMDEEINNYRISSLFWEEFFAYHVNDLDMYYRHFDSRKTLEFDDIRALKSISLLFVDSVSSQIVQNICNKLQCSTSDISDVDILDAGHSNITFKVVVRGKDYVYRYPGVSGKNIVNRNRESYSNTLAKKLKIDNTLIFVDESGHKISSFVPNAHQLNQNNKQEVKILARLVKHLHSYKVSEDIVKEYTFDPLAEADRLLNLACSNKDNLFDIFKDLRASVIAIDEELKKDNFENAICHCNLNSNNCLITDSSFDLIDWEFSGYCDVAYDFPFLGDYDFREEDLCNYLSSYYDREPTAAEYRHWMCYRVIHYWYYMCWAIFKESINEDCGNLLLVFYNNCKKTIYIAKKHLNIL